MYKIEDERFAFQINGEVKHLDPWPTYKMLYLEQDVSSYLESAESEALEDSERLDNMNKALECMREAFQLDDTPSEGQCIKVLEAFIDFCEEAKKKQHGWLILLHSLAWDSSMTEEALAAMTDSESQSSETELST